MKEERFPHTRKPLRGQRIWEAEGGSFGATEDSAATGVRRAKRRDSRMEDWCRPALTSLRGLSAHPPGWAGAGSWGSGFSQIAVRGLGLAAWTQPEGVSAPQLAGRESWKKSGAAKEARDFFLPLCFPVRKERGFRAPPKRAPETGVSCGYQRGPQRRAWDAKASAAATKKPVYEHRTLSTPPLPGACAAHHRQGPVIQEQLPQENTRCASGCCHVMQASAPAGSPGILTLPSPPAWVSKSCGISCSFNPVLSEQRTDALRWPTCRGGSKSKAEPWELYKQRREREISPAASEGAD